MSRMELILVLVLLVCSLWAYATLWIATNGHVVLVVSDFEDKDKFVQGSRQASKDLKVGITVTTPGEAKSVLENSTRPSSVVWVTPVPRDPTVEKVLQDYTARKYKVVTMDLGGTAFKDAFGAGYVAVLTGIIGL